MRFTNITQHTWALSSGPQTVYMADELPEDNEPGSEPAGLNEDSQVIQPPAPRV